MNEIELLALADALARPADVLRVGESLAFRDYLERVLRRQPEIAALLESGEAFQVSVDGRPVDGPDSPIPVIPASRVVLYRRQGATLDVLTRGVIRRLCMN